MTDRARKRLLAAGASAAFLAPFGSLARLLEAEPSQPAGPFYPSDLPLDDDSDLTRVAGQVGRAKGVICDLSGRLLDVNGRPLANHRVEIGQCDAKGRYRHPLDPGDAPLDPDFQSHGHTVTDGEGRYRFHTIRPVPYPRRTPHIHTAVLPPGGPPFVTRL